MKNPFRYFDSSLEVIRLVGHCHINRQLGLEYVMRQISYARHRFPPTVIRYAVWLYHRFTLNYRDVEELLAERGIDVSYESARRWVLKFGP